MKNKKYYLMIWLLIFISSCHKVEPIPEGLKISSLEESKEISFFAVGRQGYSNEPTKIIAESMNKLAGRQHTDFVVLAGDNFYPKGISSVDDKQWLEKFEQQYSGLHLQNLPFYAVAGNHDHDGSIAAQLQYSQQGFASGRWRMLYNFYAIDFGSVNERVLARIIFLDTVPMRRKPKTQIQFLKEEMAKPGDPIWKVIVGHYPVRSLTKNSFSKKRILRKLLPVVSDLDIDLYISANDRFQQLLQREGEPLHLSTNGGGEKLDEGMKPLVTETDFVFPQRGFARIAINEQSLTVELRNTEGELSYQKRIEK